MIFFFIRNRKRTEYNYGIDWTVVCSLISCLCVCMCMNEIVQKWSKDGFRLSQHKRNKNKTNEFIFLWRCAFGELTICNVSTRHERTKNDKTNTWVNTQWVRTQKRRTRTKERHTNTQNVEKRNTRRNLGRCVSDLRLKRSAAWAAVLIGLVLLSSKNKWNIAHHNENKDNKMSYDIV